jgi:phenylalanyl-tRNA synthetase beta chain
MRISLNWIKEYLDTNLSIDEISNLLTDIGLEVESVEEYESVKGGLKGLVVGEVLEKEKHPDADKLSVCKVDVGSEVLQIVCGAPNVAQGQKVIVALVNTTIFPSKGESFTIKKAKIRGVESVGMICAEDEIGIGDSHAGIIVLDDKYEKGSLASKIYHVYHDTIFEIGLTPNRSDAHSHIGVTRDLSAAINFRYDLNNKLKIPDYKVDSNINNKYNFNIIIENKVDCLKYLGIVIDNIKVQESPNWLKDKLKAIGQKPINNVVDVTNYVLHEFGQPLHAFDLKACIGNQIVVRNVANGTRFLTLDGQELQLSDSDLMICNETSPMCVAGVYGGKDSGVHSSTTSIFLESAYFNPKAIRKTSTKHQLRTEAAIHFEKGIDPNVTEQALCRAVELLKIIDSSIELSSSVLKIENQLFEYNKINLDFKKVRRVIGTSISDDNILNILSLLDIKCDKLNNNNVLSIPNYRVDVTRDVDVIEEILRIYGFNNVPIPSKVSASINVQEVKDKEQIYELVANYFAHVGCTEIMTNPLTKSKLLQNFDKNEQNWVRLLSSINVELDIMRNNMIFSVLETMSYNINHKNNDLKLFELGKTYHKYEDKFIENEILVLCISGNARQQHWNAKAQKSDFYTIKTLVTNFLHKFSIEIYETTETTSNLYEYGLNYKVKNDTIVHFGKLEQQFTSHFGIKQDIYYAEFNWLKIIDLYLNNKIQYKQVSKFPSVKRDLALLVHQDVKFLELKENAQKIAKKLLKEIDIFDIYIDEQMNKDQKSYALSFTFNDETKTLVDNDIDVIMNKLIESYKQNFNATLR